VRHIGVLGLQGAYAKHFAMLNSLNIKPINVRYSDELERCDGLIIPGGESTTITKLLEVNELFDPLVQFAKDKPVFGTCAGMILMAKSVDDKRVQTLNLIDIFVDRNGYGRQVHSFINDLDVKLDGNSFSMRGFFIRAPRILKTGDNVEILSSMNKEPVLVRQGHHIACSFHPELTNECRIHQYFTTLSTELSIA
tara:strand:+ start:1964 stop:2548 length:585 start_codon:yes stop_codon:yes gene_type:complete